MSNVLRAKHLDADKLKLIGIDLDLVPRDELLKLGIHFVGDTFVKHLGANCYSRPLLEYRGLFVRVPERGRLYRVVKTAFGIKSKKLIFEMTPVDAFIDDCLDDGMLQDDGL